MWNIFHSLVVNLLSYRLITFHYVFSVCELFRCAEFSCPLGMAIATDSLPGRCCPQRTCGNAFTVCKPLFSRVSALCILFNQCVYLICIFSRVCMWQNSKSKMCAGKCDSIYQLPPVILLISMLSLCDWCHSVDFIFVVQGEITQPDRSFQSDPKNHCGCKRHKCGEWTIRICLCGEECSSLNQSHFNWLKYCLHALLWFAAVLHYLTHLSGRWPLCYH